jgi:hypothetical protein
MVVWLTPKVRAMSVSVSPFSRRAMASRRWCRFSAGGRPMCVPARQTSGTGKPRIQDGGADRVIGFNLVVVVGEGQRGAWLQRPCLRRMWRVERSCRLGEAGMLQTLPISAADCRTRSPWTLCLPRSLALPSTTPRAFAAPSPSSGNTAAHEVGS